MQRLRLSTVAVFALALFHCKAKTEQSAADAGTTSVPSATPSASASAAPASPPTSLIAFEGEIDLLAQNEDTSRPPQKVNMLVKDDKIRLDSLPGTDTAKALGPKAFLLVRVPDKKLDIISESKKEILELDLSNTDTLKGIAKGAAATPPPPSSGRHAKESPPEAPPKLSKTGKKETIAGYSCEDWEILLGKEQKKKASICVADLSSSFFHISIPGMPPEFGFAQELIDGKHFPLKITSFDDQTGAESGKLEVTKFDPHALDAAKFELPAGYNTVDMAQILGALSAGGGKGIPGMPPGMPGIPSNLPVPPHPHHRH